MHCKEIMRHDVRWILPGESVAGAAKLMAFHNLGLLPICSDDGIPRGVITDRDIALRVIGMDRLAAQTVVADVMTTPVRSVASDCPVGRLGELMTLWGVSRLLVLDKSGHLDGLVSVADLLVHAPGHTALVTARGLYAREQSEGSVGRPDRATERTPESFHVAQALATDGGDPTGGNPAAENTARLESDNVTHGGTNSLKEFPA
jgi:CBS domain-containing protein